MKIVARRILVHAARDMVGSFRSLALTDLAYKLAAFALLTPAATLLLRSFAFSGDRQVLADVDIARFFLTTPAGIMTLVLGGAIVIGITAIEIACLMSVGAARLSGRQADARAALIFGAARASGVLRLTGHMVVRLLAGLLPFLAMAGLAYAVLLRDHDINYYLAERPPAFWGAMSIAAVLVAGLAAMLVRAVARWALALPLLLFENVAPHRALGESARRTTGRRGIVVVVLLVWALSAVALVAVVAWSSDAIGRSLAVRFAGSLPALLFFIIGFALAAVTVGLLVGIVNIAVFALAILRLYEESGAGPSPDPRSSSAFWREAAGVVRAGASDAPRRLPAAVRVSILVVAALGVVGFVLAAVIVAGRDRPTVVIAHRGSSAEAPENTLAAFRLAGDQRADFIELDVQESADGEVIVVHDSDLMRVGGQALRVWDTEAARLRAVDIGSYRSAQFAAERVPTLAEALEVARGRVRVIVELKSYGRSQRLEERVVSIVEAAQMADQTVFMSLEHSMVSKIKELRPSWTAGVLVAKALGDLTSLGADFLAVEARVATPVFIRRAHRAGQPVYVWTVNDPAWMLAALSRGVDGLITDKPDVARAVIERRRRMSVAERVAVALLIRLGARTEMLEAEGALRP